MASEAQIAANRRNGRKGGPKTPRGKAKSRWNAWKHGFRAKHVVIPGEDPEEFEELRRRLEEHYQPVGFVEQAYVEEITVCRWCLKRAVLFETGIMVGTRFGLPGSGEDEFDLESFGDMFTRTAPDLAKLLRYQTAFSRRLRTATQDLERAQAFRKAEEAEAAKVIEEEAQSTERVQPKAARPGDATAVAEPRAPASEAKSDKSAAEQAEAEKHAQELGAPTSDSEGAQSKASQAEGDERVQGSGKAVSETKSAGSEAGHADASESPKKRPRLVKDKTDTQQQVT